MDAERLMMIGGVTGFLLTVHWVRSRELRERYAIGWMIMAFGVLACGLFPRAIMWLAEASRLSYPAAVLFIALAAIYIFSFLVTVSLSRQYRKNVRLMQELALIEHRLRQLEQQSAWTPPHTPAERT